MTTWIKVYNSMPSHPKVLMAGDRAAWLSVCALCYSNEHLTDGFIATHALPVVAPGAKGAEKLAATLVKVGLWHEVTGGWQIHDYGEHQRSSDEIRARRAKDAERKAAGRSNGSPQFVRADSATDSARIPPGVRDVDVDVEGREQKAEVNISAELRSAVAGCFAYWQERCNHSQAQFTADRRGKLETRLRERQRHHGGDLSAAVRDVRQAIEGAAVAPYVAPNGKRFDDIELICRTGSKLEDFMGRAVLPARGGGQVVPIGRRENASDWWREINGGAA